MRYLVVSLVLAGLAHPALACLNDNELPSHEREFRSQYRDFAGSTSTPSTRAAVPGFWLPIGTGAVLLTGAFGLVFTRGRAKG